MKDRAQLTEETMASAERLAMCATQDGRGRWVNDPEDMTPRRIFRHVAKASLFEIIGGVSNLSGEDVREMTARGILTEEEAATYATEQAGKRSTLKDMRSAVDELERAGWAALTIHPDQTVSGILAMPVPAEAGTG